MEILKIFVVGSGLKGSGIAQTALQYGYEVILNDQSKAALSGGRPASAPVWTVWWRRAR